MFFSPSSIDRFEFFKRIPTSAIVWLGVLSSWPKCVSRISGKMRENILRHVLYERCMKFNFSQRIEQNRLAVQSSFDRFTIVVGT